jgi:hypothetical protein
MVQAHVGVQSALAVDAWAARRFRGIALETRDRTACVTAEGPRGERVIISDADELFALMALANAALPPTDARRITAAMVEAVEAQAQYLEAQIHALRVAAGRLRLHVVGESHILEAEIEAIRPNLCALRQIGALLSALLPQPHRVGD